MMSEVLEKHEKVRVSSTSHDKGNHRIELAGLTHNELKGIEGMAHGYSWARVVDGRVEFIPGYETPPAPTEDSMLPEWRTPREGDGTEQYQKEMFDPTYRFDGYTGSIIIRHLCGYFYTADGYRRNAEFLERCGFQCLRSRRGGDGRFSEHWFLPGLWAAEGPLKDEVGTLPKEQQMEQALKFLPTQVSFGTLDVAVQRLCQVID